MSRTFYGNFAGSTGTDLPSAETLPGVPNGPYGFHIDDQSGRTGTGTVSGLVKNSVEYIIFWSANVQAHYSRDWPEDWTDNDIYLDIDSVANMTEIVTYNQGIDRFTSDGTTTYAGATLTVEGVLSLTTAGIKTISTTGTASSFVNANAARAADDSFTRYFRVSQDGGHAEGSITFSEVGTRFTTPYTAPELAPPTSLTASAPTSSTVDLDWTDNATGEDGYEVATLIDEDVFDGTLGSTELQSTTWTQTGTGTWAYSSTYGGVVADNPGFLTVDTGDTDVVMSTVLKPNGSLTQMYGGIVFRFVDASNYWQVSILQQAGHGPLNVTLRRYLSGGSTIYASVTDVLSLDSQHQEIRLDVVVSGTTVNAWLGGIHVFVDETIATNFSTSTEHGLQNGSSSNGTIFTTWQLLAKPRDAIAANSESYTVQNLDASTQYWFRVYSESGGILSEPSNLDTETTTGSASQVTGSDSGTLSASESSSILIEAFVSGSDSGTVNATESSSFGTVAFSVSDSGTVSSTESSSFGTVGVVSSDSASPTVSESSAVSVVVSSSDSGSISVSENSTFAESAFSSSDAGTISVTESSSFGEVTLSASDTGTISVTEASSFAPIPMASSDAGAVSATESSSISVALQSSDTGNLTVSETTASDLVSSVSDSGTIAVTESSLIATSRSGSDSGTISVSEVSDIQVFGEIQVSSSDTGTITITESSGILAGLPASDVGTISISEQSSFAESAFSSNDSGTIAGAEDRTISVSESGSDSATVTVVESSDIQISGEVTKASSDSGALSVTESSSNTPSLYSSDSGVVAASEASSFGDINFASADAGTISITEASSLFGNTEFYTASDAGTLEVSEASDIARKYFGSESVSISASESSSIAAYTGFQLKVWTGSFMKYGYLKIWNGSAMEEPTVYKWSGSVMEEIS